MEDSKSKSNSGNYFGCGNNMDNLILEDLKQGKLKTEFNNIKRSTNFNNQNFYSNEISNKKFRPNMPYSSSMNPAQNFYYAQNNNQMRINFQRNFGSSFDPNFQRNHFQFASSPRFRPNYENNGQFNNNTNPRKRNNFKNVNIPNNDDYYDPSSLEDPWKDLKVTPITLYTF